MSKAPSRSLNFLIKDCVIRSPSPELFIEGPGGEDLRKLLADVESRGGILDRDAARAVKVARVCNQRSIPLAALARALGRSGATDSAVCAFIADMVPTWDGDDHLTDAGNAERLVALFGHDIRYCPAKGWFVWDGSRWRFDELGDVDQAARLVAESWRADARWMAQSASMVGKDDRAAMFDRAARMNKWATKSESAAKLRAMVTLATTSGVVAIALGEFDARPYLLPARNGTIDLRSGQLRPHSRADLMTTSSPVDYDPTARSPLWDAFLDQAADGDVDLIEFLQRAGGYTICGDAGEEVLFLVHGPGGSGKSTLMDAMRSVLGGFARVTDFEAFVKKPGGAIRNDIAALKGARMVCSIEVDEGKEIAEGLVKTITGGDTVAARFLYHEFFEFKPEFTLWLVANDPPTVDGADSGMARRIRVVPLTAAVPKGERKKWVKELLKDPDICGPAILTWLVEGFMNLQRDGLGTAPIVEQATSEYMEGMDEFGDFIAERCLIDANAVVTSRALYGAYAQWAEWNGETQLTRLTPQGLGRKLAKKGFRKQRVAGSRGWRGIGLTPSKFGNASNVSGVSALPSGENPSSGV